MISGQSAKGGVEAAVFAFTLGMSAEVLLRVIPGLDANAVNTIAIIRLGIFALMCCGLGFWIQRRYALSVSLAALSFGIGVAATFFVRAFRDDSDASLRFESLGFTVALAIANWAVLLLGAVLSKWRSR